MVRRSVPYFALLFACAALGLAQSGPAADPPQTSAFDAKIKPLLEQYCIKCHNSDRNAGGLPLDVYTSEAHAKKDRKVWENVQRAIAEGEMPPKGKPQPTQAERGSLVAAIATSITKIDCTAPKNPGRVTLRRLNKAEYNNTIRDLCGVDFKPAEDFPSDDVGYGFDNIGDVLSLQPILLEKYMTAADRVLETAIVPLHGIRSEKQTQTPQRLQVSPRSAKIKEKNDAGRDVFRIVMTTDAAAFIEKYNFPADGEYKIRAKAWGTSAEDQAAKLTIRVDGKDVKSFDVTAPAKKGEVYETRLKVANGERRVAVAFVNPSPSGTKEPRTLGLEFIEVEGPIGGGEKPLPASTKLILSTIPKDDAQRRKAAEASLSSFARRAFRRPVKGEEVARLLKLYDIAEKQGEPYELAMKLPLKAILVSPHFLFRVEDDPKGNEESRTLNEYELAARLSYFLWATMPDEELMRLAEKGDLRNQLPSQVRRMLKDAKSTALTDNFAGQWLMLRTLRGLTPDAGTYRDWDEPLRQAMVRETELFFQHIVGEDRSVLEFLDANYTFVNDRLARHYGLANVRGSDFRKVTFEDARRGGILTQASVLTVTSNPTRTSPVKRGKWVLENLLGYTPPPPPDIPELADKGELKGTLRQQMEQHRANPSCAGCHSKLDPLGFALENFDGVGKWRDTDNKQKIDSSGVLPNGEKFNGPGEMRKILLARADEFRRCLAEKLLTYSLGRGMEYYDKCILDDTVVKLKAGGDRFSALILLVVQSEPFQKRRGKRSE